MSTENCTNLNTGKLKALRGQQYVTHKSITKWNERKKIA